MSWVFKNKLEFNRHSVKRLSGGKELYKNSIKKSLKARVLALNSQDLEECLNSKSYP